METSMASSSASSSRHTSRRTQQHPALSIPRRTALPATGVRLVPPTFEHSSSSNSFGQSSTRSQDSPFEDGQQTSGRYGFTLEQEGSDTRDDDIAGPSDRSSNSAPLPRVSRPPSKTTQARTFGNKQSRANRRTDSTTWPQPIGNILDIDMVLAPRPPPPSTVPAVTLSPRSEPNPKVFFLSDEAESASADASIRHSSPGLHNFASASSVLASPAAPSMALSAPNHQPRAHGKREPSTESSSSRSSSLGVLTPASLTNDLTAAAVTPATTASYSQTPASPSLKSEVDSSADPRQDASIPDPSTPTPATTGADIARAVVSPKPPSLPAWSQPRSWAGLVSKDSGASSFVAVSQEAEHLNALAPEFTRTNVSDTPRSPQAAVLSPANGPAAQATNQSQTRASATGSQARTSTWLKNPRPTLDAVLSDAHTRFAAPLTVPRGLINTGNFCFANSILQVLVFCAPFYNLFDTVGRELSADLTNSTPLMEAVVQFLREFFIASPTPNKSTQTATSSASGSSNDSSSLLVRNPAQSEPFVPEFVYEAMRLNKRFDLMRRGHQEDAEEFLGFFLDTLHEELLAAIRKSAARAAANHNAAQKAARAEVNVNGGTAGAPEDGEEEERELKRPMSPSEDGWMEVGQKGKTAFTRTTTTSDSPITKIFGGKLRSVLRTPGAKDSVTLEPYQPLQLDIQPSHVLSIEDALLNLTVPEIIPGVFSPARGGPVDATKQVFIEHLPPVLILHLKRFLYDEVGGVQKNSKEVGYGDVLEVGGEMVSPTKRGEGSVRYRLFGVIYHHGRYANGGHYTVDVLRQDSSSWVHFDDTLFNAVAPEHVGRRPGQSLSSSVGHDGLAYLLFYRREDAPAKPSMGQNSQHDKGIASSGKARTPANVANVAGGRTRNAGATTANNAGRSAVAQGVGSRVNGSGQGAQSSPATGAGNLKGAAASSPFASPKSGQVKVRASGATQLPTSPPPANDVPRQIPGAPPGKVRKPTTAAVPTTPTTSAR